MSALDIIYVVILLFVLSVSFIFAAFFMDEFASVDAISNNTYASEYTSTARSALISFNSWYPLLIVGIFGGVLVLAWFINLHPIFYAFTLGTMFIMLILSGIMTEVFNEFASQPQFATVVNEMPIVTTSWQYIPTILAVLIFGFMLVLYTKFRRGGGSSGPVF